MLNLMIAILLIGHMNFGVIWTIILIVSAIGLSMFDEMKE